MMYTRKVVFGFVAAALSFTSAAVNTLSSFSPDTTAIAASAACSLDGCDCMPKLCTDDAIIKGTTTHLTYLCPETKTVQVTETIFITVHDGESKLPKDSTSTPGVDDKTTTLTATSKSTAFVTKTLMSKRPTSSFLGETSIPANKSLVSSSTVVAISEPKYTDSIVSTENRPEPATTVHVKSKTDTGLAMSVVTHLPSSQKLSLHSPLILTNPLRPTADSSGSILTNPLRPSTTGLILTNPLRPSNTAESSVLILTNPLRSSITGLILTNPLRPSPTVGIWSNTTTSDVVVPSRSDISVSQSSSGTESKSTLYWTKLRNATTTAFSISTNGVATSSVIHSTLTLVLPSVISSISGYGPPLVSSQINVTLSDDRPTAGFTQFTVSVSDNFISLPLDTETSWSIAGETTTLTGVELLPTIKSNATPTDMEVFPTITPDGPSSEAQVLTDGIFFSSAPSSPTAAPAKRYDGEYESSVDGTISKAYTTTTVAVQGSNLTITSTKGLLNDPTSTRGTNHSSTASEPYPGATTESLSKSGAGNVRITPMWVVVVVLTLRLAALF